MMGLDCEFKTGGDLGLTSSTRFQNESFDHLTLSDCKLPNFSGLHAA